MPAGSIARATGWEGMQYTATVTLPNLAQGLFRRRPRVVALVERCGVERYGRRLLATLQQRYGDGPLRIRNGKSNVRLVFGPDQIQFALAGAPEPFASDPEPKRATMLKFQPHALSISRDPLWTDRRRFTDAVLASAASDHELHAHFIAIAQQESRKLLGEIDFPTFNSTLRRMTRRIILGEVAADDDRLSRQLGTLMAKANPPGRGEPELYREFSTALAGYVAAGEPGSLVGLFDRAPTTEDTDPAGQVIHWMFAMGDTLATNTWRALALLATHPRQYRLVLEQLAHEPVPTSGYLAACLQDAMRVWPTSSFLARITTTEVDWCGQRIPPATQVHIVNLFNHRDTSRFDYADRFTPEVWLDGPVAGRWSFNHFSNGPQRCPGDSVAVQLGTVVAATILSESTPLLLHATLDPDRQLPYTLNPLAFRIRLIPRANP
jgi:cytochrome P450